MNKIRDMINEVLDQQDKKGMDTYGQTLADCDDNAYSWPMMALEELADAVQYLAKENLRLRKEGYVNHQKLNSIRCYMEMPVPREKLEEEIMYVLNDPNHDGI